MKRVLPFLVLMSCILSCERPAYKKYDYDLFPLQVGNVYYFSEEWHIAAAGVSCLYLPTMLSNKQWKIVSQSVSNDISIYKFEEIIYNRDSCGCCYHDTMVYELEADKTTFKLTENQISGKITFPPLNLNGSIFHFAEGPFQRYWNDKTNIIAESQSFGMDHHRGSEYHFAADSGITYIHLYSTSTMGNRYFYTCNLDSLIIFN
ncbi:hypothetical protein ACFLSP_02270 [Bacteroidota bacterium]